MASAALRFSDHSSRLSQLDLAIRFTLGALRKHEKALAQSSEVASALEKIKEGSYMLAQSLTRDRLSREEVDAAAELELERFKKSFLSAAPAVDLVLNLGLVMLCTQLELFVNHLLDVVLAAEPRRLLDLASDKEMKAREIVELGNYDEVLQRLRDKVIEEIDREGTREKFEKHLGKRFGLIQPSQIRIAPAFPGLPLDAFKEWDLERLVDVFERRHRIVHRGEFSVLDYEELGKVQLFFMAIQTVLAINAASKYSIRFDKPISAAMALSYGKWLCGFPEPILEELKRRAEGMFVPVDSANSRGVAC
jgi:hypothetical protein